MDQFEKLTPEMLNNVAGGTDLSKLGEYGIKSFISIYKKEGKTKEETKAKIRADLEGGGMSSADCDTVDAYVDAYWDSL